jgi:hypothetical protein
VSGCFIWLFLLIGGIFVMLTLLRWFEQTAEAVDNGWWHKLLLLVCMPFAVWLFPGRVMAGRPTPVPRHEPVRGFGSTKQKSAAPEVVEQPSAEIPVARIANPADVPPPGTPAEFLGIPKVVPRKKSAAAPDPEKLAKLRQKMREQGMLGPEDPE